MPSLDTHRPTELRRRWAMWAMIVSFAIVSSGCGSVRLHSETREKQGHAAEKAWSDVDLKGFFQAERDNQAKLLDAELTSTARIIAVNRESEIRVLARKPIKDLPAHYDGLLGPLVVDGGDMAQGDRAAIERTLRHARTALDTGRAKTRDFERASSFLQELGAPAFTCVQLSQTDRAVVNAWKANNPVVAQKVDRRLANATKLCIDIKTAQNGYSAEVHKIPGGTLAELVSEFDASDARAAAHQQRVDAAKAKYQDALKAYNAEVALKEAGKSTVEQTKALAEKVSAALNLVKDVQGFLSEQFVAEERLQRIDDLLASLKAGSELDSKDASKAEIAASLLPAIADDIRAIGQARKGRSAVPLLIQRDIEQVRFNSASLQLAIQRKELALRAAEVELSVRYALTIVNARSRIHSLIVADRRPPVDARTPDKKKPVVDGTPTVHAVWDKLDADDRILLLDSTTLYLDAFARQSAALDTLATQRLALAKDESIDLSEVNASMWAALIGATVTQAAEFSALGIKAEDIEKILNLLGIFYIGHGVNK